MLMSGAMNHPASVAGTRTMEAECAHSVSSVQDDAVLDARVLLLAAGLWPHWCVLTPRPMVPDNASGAWCLRAPRPSPRGSGR